MSLPLHVSQFLYYLLPYGVSKGRLGLSWLGKPKGTDELSRTQDTYLLFSSLLIACLLARLLVFCLFLCRAIAWFLTGHCCIIPAALLSFTDHFTMKKIHTCINTSAQQETYTVEVVRGCVRWWRQWWALLWELDHSLGVGSIRIFSAMSARGAVRGWLAGSGKRTHLLYEIISNQEQHRMSPVWRDSGEVGLWGEGCVYISLCVCWWGVGGLEVNFLRLHVFSHLI